MALGHHLCVDCKEKSPETELNYSLSLGLAGWREQRTTEPSGEEKVEWRCPKCWGMFKRKTRAKTQFNLPALSSIRKKAD